MIHLRMKKGLDLNISGQPSGPVNTLPKPLERIGVVPARINHVKPKLHVKTGDHVNQGALLYTDKRNPDVRFLSPGSGEIESIDFGPRRIIEAIVIRLDKPGKEETPEAFGAVDKQQLTAMSREELARHLLAGGMWPLLRSLPFRDIADPGAVPPSIIVNLDNLDPFHPPPAIYLNGFADVFRLGLWALQQLSTNVKVVSCQPPASVPKELQDLISHTIKGAYPADDPGVLLYYTRTSSDQNQSWFISGADVLALGQFLHRGVYPTERCLAVSTPKQSGYMRTRLGVPISRLVPEVADAAGLRILTGGLWRGQAVGPESYLGLYETTLIVLPDGGQSEFFGFARPGWEKHTQSRAFLSFLNRRPLSTDTGQHGEERACVNCGSCAKICPVDILPQFTLKSILAEEVEESLAHGLLDCVECGLCSYVCPSKIELAYQLRQARRDYYREKTQ